MWFCLNSPLRQFFFRFQEEFPEKISIKYQIIRFNFQIEPPFVNLKSWIRSRFYYLFYFIYMGQPIWDPYGTRLHSLYGSDMGTHIGPVWVPYRLLTG